MTAASIIVEQLLGLIEEVGTGIYMKQLDNGRKVFSCKCPVCGTIHGGYKTFEEAGANKKCREHYRKEIEKTRKEIEKVDEPKKQKDIFQNRLNRPNVIGENEDDETLDWKEFADVEPDSIAYSMYAGGISYLLSKKGLIGNLGYTLDCFTENWKLTGAFIWQWPYGEKFYSWPELEAGMDKGKDFTGYPQVFFEGKTLRWNSVTRFFPETQTSGKRKSKRESVYKLNQTADDLLEEEDIESLTAAPDLDPGAVNKSVCEAAWSGQEFWHRYDCHADGSPVRVQVAGPCLTWEDRPDEFRLPVKYGIFQTIHITEHNAGDFVSIRPRDGRGNVPV